MSRWLIALAVVALLPVTGACAHAQQTTRVEGTVRGSLGFSYGGSFASMAPDGGISTADYPVVRRVYAGSAAQLAGLAVGDTIIAVNGRDATRRPLFHSRDPGTRYTLQVRRGGEEREITFVLAAPHAPGASPEKDTRNEP